MGERGILGDESCCSGEWLASTCTDSLPWPSEVSSYEILSVVSTTPGSESDCLSYAAPECCNWLEGCLLDFFSVAEIKDTELAIKLAIIYIILTTRPVGSRLRPTLYLLN